MWGKMALRAQTGQPVRLGAKVGPFPVPGKILFKSGRPAARHGNRF
jgi:hypothetical protein